MKQLHHILYAFILISALLVGYAVIQPFAESNWVLMKKSEPGYCGNVDEPQDSAASTGNGQGKSLFVANCATCHALDKNLTGPALRGVEERGPWVDRNNLYKWVSNPAAFIPKHDYTKQLTDVYSGQIMPSFPQLKKEEADAIFDWIKAVQPLGY